MFLIPAQLHKTTLSSCRTLALRHCIYSATNFELANYQLWLPAATIKLKTEQDMSNNQDSSYEKIWKPVHGYEGLYEVNIFGTIKSIKTSNKGYIMQHRIDRAGYDTVKLTNKEAKGS